MTHYKTASEIEIDEWREREKEKAIASRGQEFYEKVKSLFKYQFDEREESLIKALVSVIIKEFYEIKESIPTRRDPIRQIKKD